MSSVVTNVYTSMIERLKQLGLNKAVKSPKLYQKSKPKFHLYYRQNKAEIGLQIFLLLGLLKRVEIRGSGGATYLPYLVLHHTDLMPTVHKNCFILKDVRLKVGTSMHLGSLELVQTWNIRVTRTVIHPNTHDDEIVFF